MSYSTIIRRAVAAVASRWHRALFVSVVLAVFGAAPADAGLRVGVTSGALPDSIAVAAAEARAKGQTSPAVRARIDRSYANNATLYALPWLR